MNLAIIVSIDQPTQHPPPKLMSSRDKKALEVEKMLPILGFFW